MQRQSLGSPGSKLTSAAAGDTEERRRSTAGGGGAAAEELKAEKTIRSGRSKPEPSIHLIPVLTLLCLFVLYLCSHDPSPSDLASVGGFDRVSDHRGLAGSEAGGGRWIRLEGSGGGVAALRNHRRLREAARLHRKLRIL